MSAARADRRFGPAFWPTVMAVPAFLLLVALGVWQLERLQWKEGLIAARHAAVTSTPVPLPRTLAEAEGMEFHHVRFAGTFLHDHEFLLGASRDDGETGFHVVTPLRLDDGSLILVDRGWIPGRLKDPKTRAAGEVQGRVEIEGLLRLPLKGRPNWFVPDNRCDIDYWFWIDLPGMAKCGHLAGLRAYYVDAGPAPNPGGWPLGGQTRLDLPNNHLQYAITWFSLAIALAVIYVLHLRSQLNAPAKKRAPSPGINPPPRPLPNPPPQAGKGGVGEAGASQ